jgi:hypothetical protein
VRAGEETKISVPVVAGTRQEFAFVLLRDALDRGRGRLRIAQGDRLVHSADPWWLPGATPKHELWLAPGSYTASVAIGDHKGSASFTVGATEASPVCIELK